MELILNRVGGVVTGTEVTMVHNGKSIEWNISAFKNKQGKDKEIDTSSYVFDEINTFWAQLETQRQDGIFNLYLSIFELFESSENIESLSSALKPMLAQLCDLHPIEELEHWMRFRSDIRIPERIGEKFEESDNPSNTRMKTYTRDDYQKLIVLALALRTIVPVWGQIVSFGGQKRWGTNWKEYNSYLLLSRSTLLQSEAMQKLRGYVYSFIPTEKNKRPSSAILAWIGSEDYPEYMLSVIVFRRVAVGDIRNSNPETHLVSSIHSYIHNRLTSNESNFIGPVREKTNRRGDDDESKISRLEGYKIREAQSGGDSAMIVRGMDDAYVMARHVSPTVPFELVDQALESVQALMNVPIQQPQENLIQFVLDQVIPAQGIQNPEKPDFLRCIAVAQAVLWHNKHYDIAAIVSARAEIGDADSSEVGMGGHGRIHKDLVEQLNIHYPYFLRPSSKSMKESGKVSNSAVVNIDLLVKQMDKYGWMLTLPSEQVKVLNPETQSRRYVIPNDIRNKLALFSIAVATRSF